jgi:hypothetical protein
MADRNRSDLEREQRGSSNPNQTDRNENRSTSSQESGMGGSKPNEGRDQGLGNETETRDNLGSNTDRDSNRPSGNSIEGDENLDRR